MGLMKLIIPNALPPKAIAASLADALETRCPALVEMLNARQARSQEWSIHDKGCTPSEGLELLGAGYEAPPNEPLGAGLGPARAGTVGAGERVWIADFCSLIIGQERTAVISMDHLDLTPSQSDALTASASDLFTDPTSTIRFEPLQTGRWRILGELPPPGRVISPDALHGRDVSDWWPMDPSWRLWRKLLNEIQMCWHDHPVNEARAQAGSPPVNGVWLYGGAHAWTAKSPDNERWLHNLGASALSGDWTSWLSDWKKIESEVTGTSPDTEIVLTGEDRIIHLTAPQKVWWKSLFNRRDTHAWRNWWANQD
jgi:hypothetical protein